MKNAACVRLVDKCGEKKQKLLLHRAVTCCTVFTQQSTHRNDDDEGQPARSSGRKVIATLDRSAGTGRAIPRDCARRHRRIRLNKRFVIGRSARPKDEGRADRVPGDVLPGTRADTTRFTDLGDRTGWWLAKPSGIAERRNGRRKRLRWNRQIAGACASRHTDAATV